MLHIHGHTIFSYPQFITLSSPLLSISYGKSTQKKVHIFTPQPSYHNPMLYPSSIVLQSLAHLAPLAEACRFVFTVLGEDPPCGDNGNNDVCRRRIHAAEEHGKEVGKNTDDTARSQAEPAVIAVLAGNQIIHQMEGNAGKEHIRKIKRNRRP